MSPSGTALPHRGPVVTILWFLIWLVSDLVGDREPLLFDPVNAWAATLIAAAALDVNRIDVANRRRSHGPATTEVELRDVPERRDALDRSLVGAAFEVAAPSTRAPR